MPLSPSLNPIATLLLTSACGRAPFCMGSAQSMPGIHIGMGLKEQMFGDVFSQSLRDYKGLSQIPM